MDKKLKAQIDKWESKTTVFVCFGSYVHLNGDFTVNELREIASVMLKREKAINEQAKMDNTIPISRAGRG
jgi:hypothetical protein